MIIGSAEVLIEPTSRGFAAQLESDLTPGVTSVAKKLGGVLAAAISIREIGSFFKSTVDEASNAEEAASKVGVVFGDMSESVTDFAANSADAFGQSNNQALEATGTFGNLFRAIELTEAQSATMSTTLTGLASDLASFNNTEVDDALLALRSGLVGETEPLKRFGVNLNEARIRQEALNLGLQVGTGVLDANVKAQAAYSLILRDTALAQGDFARTSDGLANQTRAMQAEFANAKTEIGVGLLPVAKDLVELTRGELIPTIVDLAVTAVPLMIEGFEAAEPLIGVTTSTLQALAPALETVAKIIEAIPDPLLNAAVLGYGLSRSYVAIGGAALNAGQQATTIDWSGPLDGGARSAGGFRQSLRGMTTGLNGAMVTVGLATTAFSLWSSMLEEGRNRAEEFGEGVRTSVNSEIAASTAPFDTLTEKLAGVRDATDDLSETWAGSSAPWDHDFRQELKAGIEELGQTEDSLVALRDETQRLSQIYGLTENQVLLLAQASGIDLAEATDESREAFGEAARAADNFGSVTGTAIDPVADLTEALDEERERIEGVYDALNDLIDAQLAAFSSELGYDKAVADLSDALGDYETAVESARKAAAGEGEADEALLDASFALSDAERSSRRGLADATDKVRDAEASLADARAEFGPSSEQAIRAAQNLSDAQQDLADRQIDTSRDVAKAREAVADAEVDASEQGIEAAKDLRDSMFDLRDAALGQAEAALKLAEDQAEAEGTTLSWEERNRILRTELERVLSTIGPDSPLRAEILGLVEDLDTVPGTYQANVEVDVKGKAELDQMAMTLNDIYREQGRDIRISVGGGGGLILGAADGFAGTVTRPTAFLTGEGGEPEDVLVVPQSLGGVSRVVAELAAALGGGSTDRFGRTGVNQTNHFVITESGDGRSTAMKVAKRLSGAGFRGGISGLVG